MLNAYELGDFGVLALNPNGVGDVRGFYKDVVAKDSYLSIVLNTGYYSFIGPLHSEEAVTLVCNQLRESKVQAVRVFGSPVSWFSQFCPISPRVAEEGECYKSGRYFLVDGRRLDPGAENRFLSHLKACRFESWEQDGVHLILAEEAKKGDFLSPVKDPRFAKEIEHALGLAEEEGKVACCPILIESMDQWFPSINVPRVSNSWWSR